MIVFGCEGFVPARMRFDDFTGDWVPFNGTRTKILSQKATCEQEICSLHVRVRKLLTLLEIYLWKYITILFTNTSSAQIF